jgi:outer membrane protein OmpA-like peptidoglycan-associated protein
MRFLALCLFLATPALAQVTTNDQALDALKPAAPDAAAPAPQAAPKPAPRTATHHAVHHPAAPAHPAKPTPPPQVPLLPPANPVIAPPTFVMPPHPRPAPPPVPIKADAPGTATAIPGGARITFGPDGAALNQATHDAIVALAEKAKADPGLQISITAWAPGTTDDPSPPRSLALERALAARAVMINAGIVSDRIFAVSKGFDGIAGGPPDRMDITLAAPKQTPAGSPLPPPAASAQSGAAPSGATQPAGARPATQVNGARPATQVNGARPATTANEARPAATANGARPAATAAAQP